MGTTGSKPTVTSVPGDANFGQDQTSSGVRVTGAVFNEATPDAQQAFEKGKQEAASQFNQQLELIAAQTYGSIQEQLTQVQRANLEKSKQMGDAMREKFVVPSSADQPCQSQGTILAACMKDKRENPLACKEFVEAYYSCAVSSTV